MSWRDILMGAASILDFAGYLRQDRYFESDRMAIASDWQAVGDDLQAAMQQFEESDATSDLLDQGP